MRSDLDPVLEIAASAKVLSLHEARFRSGYERLRPTFGADDLRLLLEARPQLVEDWLSYSEDKRTSGGWYVLRSAVIGQVSDPGSVAQFGTIAEAVAEYVICEMDYWTAASHQG